MYNILIENNFSKADFRFTVNLILNNAVIYKPIISNRTSELDDSTQKEIDGLREILRNIKRDNEVFLSYPGIEKEVFGVLEGLEEKGN